MLSFDRRRLLIILSAAALAGCDVAPVYGPGGVGPALQGRVALADPKNDSEYELVQRLEDRLGRVSVAQYRLTVALNLGREDLGTSSDGRRTRYQLFGKASYSLQPVGSGATIADGSTEAFTGYSTTGSTVATLAAERDAQARLATILADQIVDALLLSQGSLSQ